MRAQLYTMILFFPAIAHAQGRIEYEYDEVGNRICQSCEMPAISKAMSRPLLPVSGKGNGDVGCNAGIRVYPNLTTDVLYIALKNVESNGNYRVMLYNSQGALIMSKENIESETTDISLGQLPVGTYLLTVFENEMQTTFKVIKQ